MKILCTGANGLLGTALANYIDFIGIDYEDCDITDYKATEKVFKKINPDLTIHLAAIVDATDKDQDLAFKTNVNGTEHVGRCSKHIIYISTDYVFDGKKGNYKEDDEMNPQTFYGSTKMWGEEEASIYCKYNIIRTSFKAIPFKHDQAPSDMYTTADYVPIIAYHIAQAIKNYDKLPPILHIGTEKKSVYQLAIRTKPNIKRISIRDINAKLPKDCSLNTDLWRNLNLT